jgi:hypothetical protein
MSVQEAKVQKLEVIVQTTRGVHGNRHEHYRMRDPRKSDGNGGFSYLPYFSNLLLDNKNIAFI